MAVQHFRLVAHRLRAQRFDDVATPIRLFKVVLVPAPLRPSSAT
jgi:hypothetical protein